MTQSLQRHPRRQHDHLSGASQHAVHQRPADAGGDRQFGPSGQLRLDHDRRLHHRRLDDQLRRGGNLFDHRLAGRQRHLRPGHPGDPEPSASPPASTRSPFRRCPTRRSPAPPPTPAATASSGLPVSYASTTTGVCTIAGSTISFVAAGTCSITASQAGNASYAPATPVTQSFSVAPGVNTIAFPALPNTPFTSAPPTPAATASSGLPVSYASTTTGVCTIAGSTISFVAAGTCSITASQAGNATYAPATPVTQSFSVTAGRQHDHLSGAAQHAVHQRPADAGGDRQFGPSGQLRLDHDRRLHHSRLDDQLRGGGNLFDHRLAGRQRQLRPGHPGDPDLQHHEGRQYDHIQRPGQ